jgi:hypothetical protein
METTLTHRITQTGTKTRVWTARIIKALCIAFLLFDAIMKIIKESHSIDASIGLGLPESSVQGIGITLLICTILYVIPRTAILGAVLLTGYLSGAIAIMLRAEQPLYFALVFGIMVWVPLCLNDGRLRLLRPFARS